MRLNNQLVKLLSIYKNDCEPTNFKMNWYCVFENSNCLVKKLDGNWKPTNNIPFFSSQERTTLKWYQTTRVEGSKNVFLLVNLKSKCEVSHYINSSQVLLFFEKCYMISFQWCKNTNSPLKMRGKTWIIETCRYMHVERRAGGGYHVAKQST